MLYRNLLCLVITSVLLSSIAPAQEFKTAREARAAANAHLRTQNYAAAQAPLEAALKLTPETDLRERVELYRALMSSYRLLPDIEKMTEAVEYIQQNSEQQAERSIIATDFVSFLQQRGKADEAIARYEERLKKNPKDPTALAVLSRFYLRLRPNQKERGKTLEAELQTLDRERTIAVATKREAAADADPKAAASNWKDIAKLWLEAGDKDKAIAAAERSQKSLPEARSSILQKFWHEGLGDVFLELGERDRAITEFEAVLKYASSDPLKKPIQAKIDKAKGTAGKN